MNSSKQTTLQINRIPYINIKGLLQVFLFEGTFLFEDRIHYIQLYNVAVGILTPNPKTKQSRQFLALYSAKVAPHPPSHRPLCVPHVHKYPANQSP